MASDLMRLASFQRIFGPNNIPSSGNPSALGLPEEGPASKAYRDFLGQPIPSRYDFAPSKLDRLGAILSGVSAGITQGGPAGMEAGQSALERPYRTALQDYSLRGGQLGEAARAEESAADTRFKNALALSKYETSKATEDRLANVADAQIKNYESLIGAREQDLISKGWTPTVDKITGQRIYTRVNPLTGQVDTIKGDKVEETPEEESARKLKENTNLAGIRFGFGKKLFDYEEAGREETAKRRESRAEGRELSKEQRAKLEREARDRSDIYRESAARALVYRDIISKNPKFEKYFDLEKMTHSPEVEPAVQQAMKARGF